MNIEYKFYLSIDDEHIKNQLWEILCECDKEFFPPLSSRESSYQNILNNIDLKTDIQPHSYFNEMLNQLFVLAFEKDTYNVVGFLSFKHNYESEELKGFSPSNYITTSCIRKKHRNQKIGKNMYLFFENEISKNLKLPFITRRTWSTNLNQIHIFGKIGFENVNTLINHRGEGVHTIYFAKKHF